jgi:PAS domain S-box-containing protein
MFIKKEILHKIIIWSFGLMVGFVLSSLATVIQEGRPEVIILLCVLLLLLSVVSVLAIRCRKMGKDLRETLNSELQELHHQITISSLRYKSLLDNAGDAIFVINAADGSLEEINHKASILLGYEHEELGQLNGRNLVTDQEQRKFSSLVQRVKRRGNATSDGMTFRRKDGGTFLGEVNAILVDLGNEQVVQAIVRDITFKSNRELSVLNNIVVRANQSLQLQKVLDVTLLDALKVFDAQAGAIHLMEAEGESLSLAASLNLPESLTSSLEQITTKTPLFGKIISSRRHLAIADLGKERNNFARAAAEAGWKSFAGIPLVAKGQLIGMMHILTTEPRHFVYEHMKLFNTIGNQMGIIIEHARLFEELNSKTEELLRSHRLLERSSHQLALSQNRLKKNLAIVERANTELESLDRMKNHFLGMISHEFRTPLTSILSGTEFLINCQTTEQAGDHRQVLEMIHQGGTRLNEIVSDLLKIVRLEANTTSLANTPLKLSEILFLIREQMEPVLAKRNLSVVFGNLDHLPFFHGDREYLEEAFNELLENAIKFTPDNGAIAVSARVADRLILEPKRALLETFNPSFYGCMGEKAYIEVEVHDNGIGIQSAEQMKIFEKFYEVGDIRHHSTGKDKFQGKGAGLGLAIVKGMVEAHGGMVWVESTPSASDSTITGSSFFVLIPLEESHQQHTFPFMLEDVSGNATTPFYPDDYEENV